MASGVKVSEDVKKLYNIMKVVKNDDEEEDRIRLATFIIAEEIVPDKVFKQKDLMSVKDVFKFMESLLDNCHCCYMLYDCHFEIGSMKREELVFIMWAPDTAPVKEKMCYASSKNAIGKVFDGVKHVLQMNDPTDHEKSCFVKQVDKKITVLEGNSLDKKTCAEDAEDAKDAKDAKCVKGQ